jgi:hypothetical protein
MNILYDERLDGALPDVNKAGLLQALQHALPDLDLLWREDELKPYECDGLSAYRTTPMLVALPRRLEQVQTLLSSATSTRAGGGPRRRHRVVGRRAAAGKGPAAGDGALQQHPAHRPAARTARVPARGAQPGDLPGRRALRPVLRAGPVLADRLLDRRQRRRKRRWRALPEVRPDRAQPAQGRILTIEANA